MNWFKTPRRLLLVSLFLGLLLGGLLAAFWLTMTLPLYKMGSVVGDYDYDEAEAVDLKADAELEAEELNIADDALSFSQDTPEEPVAEAVGAAKARPAASPRKKEQRPSPAPAAKPSPREDRQLAMQNRMLEAWQHKQAQSTAPPLASLDTLAAASLRADARRSRRQTLAETRGQAAQAPSAPPPLADDFFARRQQTEQLPFQTASGYWANTYIPDDPLLRRLHARVQRHADSALPPQPQPVWQPFDAPRSAAMNLFLHADQRAVQGATRLLLQVGLKGTPRHSGRRPAMNVGLVVDRRQPLSDARAALLRALLHAFVQARQNGDRFSLSVAGRAEPLLLTAEDFRHGPLTLAMQTLFSEPTTTPATNTLSVALDNALARVREQDDPDAPLGSSLLIVISDQAPGSEYKAVETLAYRSALAGIPLSFISLGAEALQNQVEDLVLAGQGRFRLLQRSSDAPGLVDKELFAVSRVVARALRLNIRLHEGVKLVEVIGSERLDAPQAQQVRQVEQFVDERLRRNLGIQRDRGADDDGIQVLIPAFHAEDSHVVLLDVVAEKPGLLAEVTLKYKDLVYARNGQAKMALALGSEPRPPGPLELNVLKNLLAHRLADTLRNTGAALAAQDQNRAQAILAAYEQLLRDVRASVADWRNDTELAQDLELLAAYQRVFSQPETAQALLDEHLRYAAFSKLLPLPKH